MFSVSLSSLQEDLSSLLDDYEQKMRDLAKEIPDMKDHYEANALAAREESNLIGEMVMDRLAGLDEVAYVRFASVYRQFKDINTFMSELTKLLQEK